MGKSLDSGSVVAKGTKPRRALQLIPRAWHVAAVSGWYGAAFCAWVAAGAATVWLMAGPSVLGAAAWGAALVALAVSRAGTAVARWVVAVGAVAAAGLVGWFWSPGLLWVLAVGVAWSAMAVALRFSEPGLAAEFSGRARLGLYVADWKANCVRQGWTLPDGFGGVQVPRLVKWWRDADRWHLVVHFQPGAMTQVPVLVGQMPAALPGCHSSEFAPFYDERYGEGLTEVTLSFVPFPVELGFDHDAAAEVLETSKVWLGRSSVGHQVYVDLAEEPCWGVFGAKGSGKSVVAFSLLTQWCNKLVIAEPDERPRIVLVDFKKDAKYNRLLDYGVERVSDIGAAIEMLTSIERSLGGRQDEANAAGVDVYQGPATLLVVDELARLTTDRTIPDGLRAQVLNSLAAIAEMGRSLRVYLVLCTQSGSKDVVGGQQIVTNIKSSVIGLAEVGDFRQHLFGNDPDVRFLCGIAGRGVIRGASTEGSGLPSDTRGLQVGLVDYEKVDEYLLPLPDGWGEPDEPGLSDRSRSLVSQLHRRNG